MIDMYAYSILVEVGKRGKCRFTELLRVVRNPKTLNKKLKMLISVGLIEVQNRLYSITARGVRVMEMLNNALNMMNPKIDVNVVRIPHLFYASLLKKYCQILYDHFGERLLGVLVFGSVARGDWNRDSDIDLLTVVKAWTKFTWERSKELLELRNELRRTTEYRECIRGGYIPIIQHYPLDSEEALVPHRLYIDACMDGIILYEKNNFLSSIMDGFRRKLVDNGAKRIQTPEKVFYWVLKPVKAGEIFEI